MFHMKAAAKPRKKKKSLISATLSVPTMAAFLSCYIPLGMRHESFTKLVQCLAGLVGPPTWVPNYREARQKHRDELYANFGTTSYTQALAKANEEALLQGVDPLYRPTNDSRQVRRLGRAYYYLFHFYADGLSTLKSKTGWSNFSIAVERGKVPKDNTLGQMLLDAENMARSTFENKWCPTRPSSFIQIRLNFEGVNEDERGRLTSIVASWAQAKVCPALRMMRAGFSDEEILEST